MDLIFIGDRPAQRCALVLDSPVKYTGERLDPFLVQRMVERYVTDYETTAEIRRRHVVLSTGLTWAPKYTGMVSKQISTILRGLGYATPAVFVLPVSTRILLGHAINTKLADLCVAMRSRTRNHRTYFLGHRDDQHPSQRRSFAGDAADPTQPTPVEVMDILAQIQLDVAIDNLTFTF
jgi:hypothetical protein